MKTLVEEMVKDYDEIMDEFMKAFVDKDTIEMMDTKEFELLKKSLDFMNKSKQLLIESAELMDSMNEKLDKLLVLNMIKE